MSIGYRKYANNEMLKVLNLPEGSLKKILNLNCIKIIKIFGRYLYFLILKQFL